MPTRIYALADARDLQELGIEEGTAGFFTAGLRQNSLVVSGGWGDGYAGLLLHEFAHFLVIGQGQVNYPKWFNEGFAEYLSAMEIRGDSVVMGLVPAHRRGSLASRQWLPTKRIIEPLHYQRWPQNKKAMFYAQSWALVHYLIHRQDRESSFGDQLARYLELMETGVESLEAFERAFGLTPSQAGLDSRFHVRRSKIPGMRVDMNNLLAGIEYEVRQLGREEAQYGIATIALVSGDGDVADRLFEAAAGEEDLRARALAGRGDVRKFAGDYEAAWPFFAEALELAPEDPYVQLDVAQFWHDRARASDDENAKRDFLRRARQHYVAAWKLDDAMPETLATYGDTFIVEGRDYDKAVEMLEHAASMLPSHAGIRLSLARAYLGAGRFTEAVAQARAVVTWSHSYGERENEAREIVAEAERRMAARQ